ncbi:MAG: hypothetical protein QNJ14_00925 [Woeseiaceae bacterium]|nr:hypothetical protein [Woeseiaceae bacterium]
MEDITTLYDDLVAVRRATKVLPETASRETRDDLEDVIRRAKAKLTYELALLPEEERHDIMYELDCEYAGGVWEELEGLL